MTRENELLPCPFCGGEAARSAGTMADGSPWPYIECLECGASAEPDMWNRRAALSEREIPPILYDGPRVYTALTNKQLERTGPENVSDVLDAIVKCMRKDRAATFEEAAAALSERVPAGMEMLMQKDRTIGEALEAEYKRGWQAALRHAVELLADDASALTYQTMGQYRHAMMVTLLREAEGEGK